MEWVAVFWACVASGVIAVPVDFRFSEELVRRIQSEADPKLVIDRRVLDEIAGLPRVTAFQPVAVSPGDIVEIVYTSGTTGEPKGVTHRHRHICANLRPFKTEIDKYKKWARPFQPIRILDLLPLSHMFGQALGIYIPALLGGAVAFTAEMHPGKLVQIIREHRISVVVAVPQILENLSRELERRFHIPSSSRSVLVRLWRARRIRSAFGWKFWALVAGGAPVEEAMEDFWAKLGFLVVQGYGLTEASPVVAVNHPFDAKRGSLGKVLPGVEVTIAPDGEILVRGESVTTGDGGWLHTGDLGAMDHEGRLYYRGRKKDIIVTPEGLNVHPEDVERVLNGFPEIRASAVVSVLQNGKEQVHAAVVLNDLKADVGALVKEANQRLEPYQMIKGWSVWPEEDFPRTASTMKVRRGEVARRLSGVVPAREPEQTRERRDLSSMSSLERVELLSELENRYRIDLDEEEFSKLKTSGELDEWLQRSCAGAPALPRNHTPSAWPRAFPLRAFRTAFQQLIAIPLFKHYLPLTVTGLEHFQDLKPPVIFAANHTSHLDAPAVLAALPSPWRRRLAPAMGLGAFEPYIHPERFTKKEVWWTGLGYFLARLLFNTYPLPQEVAGVRRALHYTGELIQRGYCPLVFPEGMRTPDGKLLEFRPGVGMMTVSLRVLIVPVYIEGLYELYSLHDTWPKRGPVHVVFGKALKFTDETYGQVAQQVRRAVEDLARQSRN
jgi:long-chain acyl-CoA synthetase